MTKLKDNVKIMLKVLSYWNLNSEHKTAHTEEGVLKVLSYWNLNV